MPDLSHSMPAIELADADRKAGWGNILSELARQGLTLASERFGLVPPDQVRIVTFGNNYEFENYLQSRPTEVVAVARPEASEIVILRPAFFSETPSEQIQTLTHEMAHL